MASQWASFPRQNCAPSVAARGAVILLRGGIDVPHDGTSAVVPREKFQELPVLGIPGMSESAFDGWALEGAANGPTTAASVVASAVPGATTSGMPPSSTTYPRPTSYPGSPPPVIFPNTRPVIMQASASTGTVTDLDGGKSKGYGQGAVSCAAEIELVF
jgi:hypothetical protein